MRKLKVWRTFKWWAVPRVYVSLYWLSLKGFLKHWRWRWTRLESEVMGFTFALDALLLGIGVAFDPDLPGVGRLAVVLGRSDLLLAGFLFLNRSYWETKGRYREAKQRPAEKQNG